MRDCCLREREISMTAYMKLQGDRPMYGRAGAPTSSSPPGEPSAVRVEMTLFSQPNLSTTGVPCPRIPTAETWQMESRSLLRLASVTTTRTVAGVEIGSGTASKVCISFSILELKGQRPITSSWECPPFCALPRLLNSASLHFLPLLHQWTSVNRFRALPHILTPAPHTLVPSSGAAMPPVSAFP